MKTSNNNTRGRGRGNKDGEQHELPSNIFTTQSSNSNLMNHNIHLVCLLIPIILLTKILQQFTKYTFKF
ncbi:hypothetical protein GLOIN_2v1667303 [Rhizophagus irregularis DAOM 181602=DAOM 197198]|nr:hypothetical protein GLOIN_2v1667303 [Rhizophagus irregularis DAOM 181602=DAOM 197198]